VDLFDPLIDKTRQFVSEAQFIKEDVLSMSEEHTGAYDIIFAVGVLSPFEDADLTKFWQSTSRMLKPGGRMIVLAPRNERGIDMMLRHRKWLDGKRGGWEWGWSIPSKQTVKLELEENFANFEISLYTPEIDLEPRTDPIRSWTIPYGEHERQLTNGLNLLIDYHLIIAQK
jgi:SAM-dependent methyltransferase